MCGETGSVSIEINGTTFKALVDTGAQVSCLAHSVFKQLKLTTDTDRPKQTLTHAGGGPLHTHGTSTVTLTVETIPFTHSFHIIETPSHKIILGLDFLKTTEANISVARKQLQLHTTNSTTKQQYTTFTAITKSAITLPPKSLALISVTCNTDQDVNTCIAEPVTSLALKHNIAGARCIVQTNNSTTCYQVFNPSDTTVTLQQGTVLQKQEVQQVISTISISSVTNQQFLDQKVALEKLSANLDKLSSFVDELSRAELPSVTSVKVQQDSSSSPIASKLPVCTRCGKRSYSEKTCGSNHLYCYICGKKGHLARCCRTKDPGSCGRCGSTDHVSHNCGAFRKGTICWLCFKPGHLYRSCNTKFKIL